MARKKSEVLQWMDRVPMEMPVYYALALNLAQFDRALDHLKIPMRNRPNFVNNRADATLHWFDVPSENDGKAKLCAIVCVTPNEDPVKVCGLLVHEAVHIWQEVERIMGNMGSEGEAYHIQSISQELFMKYSELRNELEAGNT